MPNTVEKIIQYMERINKLSLPVTILIASVILGGFYYAGEVSKQRSIERQQEVKIAEEKRIEEEKAKELKSIEEEKIKKAQTVVLQKKLCVSQAEQAAMELYKDYCTANSYCTYKEGTYMVPQYKNAYSKCLQSYGLE